MAQKKYTTFVQFDDDNMVFKVHGRGIAIIDGYTDEFGCWDLNRAMDAVYNAGMGGALLDLSRAQLKTLKSLAHKIIPKPSPALLRQN